MNDLGAGFDLIKTNQGLLIDSSPFSVKCVLSNGSQSQELRGLPNQIGLSIDGDGLPVQADSAEFFINMASVTIGVIVQGWTITIYNYDGTKDYKIQSVMRDKTLGVYRMQITLLKATGKGTRISRVNFD